MSNINTGITALLSGNEAAVYASLLAGCTAYYGYPITPAGEIIQTAARLYPAAGRTFLQAESEIAAINMVMGASAAGQRVMTASSGLGISLKQEAVSYMAAMELPGVIVDITRSGPGLGNIAVEQSDYNQVVKGGGHGGYQCLVLAPYSAQEMADMTLLAFELAERYRMVCYVLADQVIGQMTEKVVLPTQVLKPEANEKSLGVGFCKDNFFSSIRMEAADLSQANEALYRKYTLIQAQESRYEAYYCEDAEAVLVAYGISARIALEAVRALRSQGHKVGWFRPQTLWPFPQDGLNKCCHKAKKIFSVELSAGQMIDDIRLATECRLPVALIKRMGGVLFTVNDVIQEVEAAL